MVRRNLIKGVEPNVGVDLTDGSMSVRSTLQPLLELRLSAIARAIFKDSLVFFLCCVYLMLEYVRPQSIYESLSIFPFAQVALIGGTGIAMLEASKSRAAVHGSQWPLLLTYLALAACSLIFATYPASGWPYIQLLIGWLMAIYLITRGANTIERYFVVYFLFLLFSLKMSQHGFRSWAGAGFGFIRSGVHGAPGWFRNSGEVGIQMCIFLPMMLHFSAGIWKHLTPVRKAIVCFVPITIIGTIIGSSSRGAMIGAAAALAWMALRTPKYRLSIAVALLLVGSVVTIVTPEQFIARFDTMGQDNTSITRLDYWKFGGQLLKENPVLGIGIGNWMPVYTDHLRQTGSNRRPQLPHNIFVQAGAELGILGLIVLLLLIGATFVLNSRSRRIAVEANDSFLRHSALGLDAGMVGFLVSAQFVTVLYYPYLWIAIALSICLRNVAIRTYPEHERGLRQKVRTTRVREPTVGSYSRAALKSHDK